MVKRYVLGAVLLLGFLCGEGAAQPSLDALHRWATVPAISAPIASGRNFDLAFGADQLPVLAFLDGVQPILNLRKWNGSAWTTLNGLSFVGQVPLRVRMASNWAGEIVLGLLMSTTSGALSIEVHQLRGTQLTPLGPVFSVPNVTGYSVAIDARGPVLAWKNGGFIKVRRWNGVAWSQLGGNVNPTPNTFGELQSPALAVTGDGKLVVAYPEPVGDGFGIAARVWDGTGWNALGTGISPPAFTVSLGGENSGAPVAAYRGGGTSSRVSRWNGTTWQSIGQPCVGTIRDTLFGNPSLTVRGNQPVVVCGIHVNAIAVSGRRTLVARALSRLSGWEPLGVGTINGETALPADGALAYVIRSDARGRPWVAWTAQSGVFVSTLVPPNLSPGP